MNIHCLLDDARNMMTLVLIEAAGVLLALAVLLGISDNPPGITLLYTSALVFVLAFTRGLRTARQFLLLSLVSVLALLAFVPLAILGDVSDNGVLNLLGVGAFLAALVLCPAALIVGLAGAAWRRRRRHHRPR